MVKKSIIVLFLLFNVLMVFSQKIIPLPVFQQQLKGDFLFSSSTQVFVNSETSLESVNQFNDFLSQYYGFKLIVTKDRNPVQGKIYIELIKDSVPGYYQIKMNSDEIEISGGEEGIFYAFQTLKQMLVPAGKSMASVNCTEITDYPRFRWRGMHLDVSRHFVTVDSVKKYIDYISMYKMNRFHWHLTDDQGWRIEIKKYPKLTQVGGFRNGTLIGSYSVYPHTFDSLRYGGFYTQEQIKEVVEYAKKRFVTILPEIEMPGHSLAALAAYPEYSCTGGPFEVANAWGVFDDVYCAKDSTFNFLTDVLNEVMDLFPGEYIHIGGDECPKTRWKVCPGCQEIIKRESLKDESELQSYFIKRIEKIIEAGGKKLIGWDEILEGGLPPNAAVMSWRGTQGGIDAARQKHYVVMSPGSHCYFDHYQGTPTSEPLAIGGYTTVEKVYSYEPVPGELSAGEQKYILGAQGNVWTEYMPCFTHIEYMIFPRICALSEVLWSGSRSRNWDDFRNRLVRHFSFLDMQKINYAKSVYEIKAEVKSIENGLSVKLSSVVPVEKICYTMDGSEPAEKSMLYNKEILLGSDGTIKAAAFEKGMRRSPLYQQSFSFSKATGKNVILSVQPNKSYNTGGAFTLIDGILGKIPWYGKEWLGFLNDEVEISIDLEKTDSICNVIVDVLDAQSSWIYLPGSIEVSVSDDNINFKSVRKADIKEIEKAARSVNLTFDKTVARYVKVRVANRGIIPDGLPGAGNKAWLFIDEIQVR